jgi:dsDNA-specific endonuclease/ATPase MutS2
MTALATDDDSEDSAEDSEDVAVAALTDELDLHTFRPQECADVVEEYLYAVQEQGMTLVRVIHGKGTGTLRRIVHSVLDKHPAVARYALAAGSGSWGATLVELKPKP